MRLPHTAILLGCAQPARLTTRTGVHTPHRRGGSTYVVRTKNVALLG